MQDAFTRGNKLRVGAPHSRRDSAGSAQHHSMHHRNKYHGALYLPKSDNHSRPMANAGSSMPLKI